MILVYISLYIYIYLFDSMEFICHPGFHVAEPNNDNHQAGKKNIWEIEKIEKYSQKNVYVGICMDFWCACVCVCKILQEIVCVCVCVCVYVKFYWKLCVCVCM